MNFVKGYLTTKESKKNVPSKKITVPPQMELTVSSPMTPGGSTSISDSFSARHLSAFPEGDFRNRPDSILDIKNDVMCSWLHQKQLAKLWSTDLPGEGVVLKKSRSSFACKPDNLANEANGLYDSVVAMNVRVCFLSKLSLSPANAPLIVCHDCSHSSNHGLPLDTELRLRPTPKWPAAPGFAFH